MKVWDVRRQIMLTAIMLHFDDGELIGFKPIEGNYRRMSDLYQPQFIVIKRKMR